MSFTCCMCKENISTYRVDVHRIEDNEIVESREYCKECMKKLIRGD